MNRITTHTPLLRSVAGLLAPLLAALAGVAILIGVQAQRNETRRVDALVLLCSPAAQPACASYAHHLYQRHYAPRLVVTSNTGNTLQNERAALRALEIPDSAIVLAEHTPRRSAVYDAVRLAHRRRYQRVLLLDRPEAMLRNLKMARDLGIEAYGAPLPDSRPDARAIASATLRYWHYVLAEGPAPLALPATPTP